MKHIVKKSISLIMVLILLLGALAGCGNAMYDDGETTPSVNAGANPDDLGSADNNDSKDNENEEDPTRVFTLDSLEPLSKEKQAEVEAAWELKNNYKMIWYGAISNVGDLICVAPRYYGTFNNYIVIFSPMMFDTAGKLKIAGQEIRSNYLFEILVYADGEFYDITIAHQNEWLTDSELIDIVEYHNAFEEYERRRIEKENEE